MFKIRALQPFLVSNRFHPAALAAHSLCAAALCAWVLYVVCSRPSYLEWLGEKDAEVVRSASRSALRGHAMPQQQGCSEGSGGAGRESLLSSQAPGFGGSSRGGHPPPAAAGAASGGGNKGAAAAAESAADDDEYGSDDDFDADEGNSSAPWQFDKMWHQMWIL